MGTKTSIGWTAGTLNLWEGCNKVAATCKNCYAARQTHWLRPNDHLWGLPANGAYRREVRGWRDTLAKLSKKANEMQVALPVFVGSMMDIWEDGNTPTDTGRTIGEIRNEFLDVLPRYPHLVFQLLTSRPQNILPILNGRKLPANVWLGASIGNQAELDTMGRALVDIPSDTWEDGQRRRFLSIEPMLGPISLAGDLSLEGPRANEPYWVDEIDWVIVGGESGPKARPMKKEWVEQILEDCGGYPPPDHDEHILGIQPPVFVKQWGEFNEQGNKVGTAKSGRQVQGREYNNMPVEMYYPLNDRDCQGRHDLEFGFTPTVWGMDYSLVYAEPWFSLCRAGIKTEEYRNPASKSYRDLRELVGKRLHGCRLTGYHGYKADRKSFVVELLAVTIGEGKPEWGATPGEEYLVLHLGRVLDGAADKTLIDTLRPQQAIVGDLIKNGPTTLLDIHGLVGGPIGRLNSIIKSLVEQKRIERCEDQGGFIAYRASEVKP
jgi:protein gp37